MPGAKEWPLLVSTLTDRAAKVAPNELIVTKTSDGYHRQTFSEHQERSEALVAALRHHGYGQHTVVGTLLHNCSRHLELHHAVPAMGGVLHTLNIRLSPRELDYVAWHGGDRILFVDETLLPVLEAVATDPACVRRAIDDIDLVIVAGADGRQWDQRRSTTALAAVTNVVCYEDFIATGAASNVDRRCSIVDEEAPVGLCYTSGTTGDPKGVCFSQRSVYLHTLAICLTDCMQLSARDVVCPVVPMFHISSWGLPYASLMLGFRTVLPGRYTDAQSLLDMFHDEGVTISMGVPTIWQGIRSKYEATDPATRRWDLGALERLICGGSAPPLEMMRWWDEVLGVEFVQAWGMTETSAISSTAHMVNTRQDIKLDRMTQYSNVDKQGILLPGLEGLVVSESRQPLPHNGIARGDLLVRGPWVTSGYHGVEPADATSNDSFLRLGSNVDLSSDTTPRSTEDFRCGYCNTGDVCVIEPGEHIRIVDRTKDLIKSGGEWISSVELENALTAVHGVAQACVVAQPHPRWDERPVALCVPEIAEPEAVDATPRTSPQAVLSALAATGHFAKYELPDEVLFVSSIPLTSTGKIDKKAVRAQLAEDGYLLPSLRSFKGSE